MTSLVDCIEVNVRVHTDKNTVDFNQGIVLFGQFNITLLDNKKGHF